MAKMKAAMAAVLVMEKEGITQAFGVPGAAINPLYAQLRERQTIAHVLARHVEGASHMAEGYTRARAGNIGVCIGTSGPAGTDMITGLYTAQADSTLGARYLGTNPWVMVAEPAYLREHGTPRSAADLPTHACLLYSSVQGDDRWTLTTPAGDEVSVPVRGPLRSNNLSVVLAAARDGLGLAVLPWYVARESVAEGVVQPVLTDHGLPAQEVHAVFPSPKLVPSKVTSFIAYLQQALAGEWWRHAL